MTASDEKGHSSSHEPDSQAILLFVRTRLKLISNPFDLPDHDENHQNDHDKPSVHDDDHDPDPFLKFIKRPAASTAELFYDLWFVANLTVFATVHPITEFNTLISFIAFFLLLWITWFVTTVFYTRFGLDGVVERFALGCHLAVMLGFAILGVCFDEDKFVTPVIKAVSLFLMVSRIVLTAQYGVVLWHARHHKRSRKSLSVAVVVHLVPAIMFMVASILTDDNKHRSFLAIWFVVGLCEMMSVVIHSTVSRTLSFEGTHFNERLNLLTLIVIGEGVIILTKNMSKLVQYTFLKDVHTSWSPPLIGTLLCSASILYISFHLYFDWMHHHNHLNLVCQAFWTILHLPFHAILVLMAEGSTQWGVWWRALEAFSEISDKMEESVKNNLSSQSSKQVALSLYNEASRTMNLYGIDTTELNKYTYGVNASLARMSRLPNTFWTGTENVDEAHAEAFIDSFLGVTRPVLNSVLKAFTLNDEHALQKEGDTTSWHDAKDEVDSMIAKRLHLVFVYLFVCSSLVLVILMFMHILSKRKGWTPFNIIRAVIVFAVAGALGAVAAVKTNVDDPANFVRTPWPLPTVTLCYFFIMVLSHVPHPTAGFLLGKEAEHEPIV
ncbi:unnamed protein product [Clonostachys rosea]|uniref:Transmembrane protein n=1 Tax=Bionectria ochroleuca TaxID=29856 RepID=A0ABY6TYJ0_BIOOC|nr:unnamed protein product [Clonostachys rosea]